jgi:hypothetical protein
MFSGRCTFSFSTTFLYLFYISDRSNEINSEESGIWSFYRVVYPISPEKTRSPSYIRVVQQNRLDNYSRLISVSLVSHAQKMPYR